MTSADEPVLPPDAPAAFEELARISLDEHSMESVVRKVADLAQRFVPGVDEASVSLLTRGRATTVAATGALAARLDEVQYDADHGPCLDAARGGELQEVPDMRSETRWPQYARSALAEGSLSSLSVPVPVQQQVHAALNLYSRQVGAFDAPGRDLARTFASYAAVAMTNMHLYESSRQLAEQLQTAMQSRAVIDQAKGVLMARHHITADEAFRLLSERSQASNRKLRDLAQELVDEATGQ